MTSNQQLPSFRVDVVEVGRVRVRPDNVRGTWRPMLWWTATARAWTEWLPVNVVVIAHPHGVVLFDTGQHPDSVTDPDYYPAGLLGWIYRRQAEFQVAGPDPLSTAVRSLGIDLDQVHTVVLSHLHQDHAGNLGEVSGARVLLDPDELALMQEKNPAMHGVLPERIAVPAAGLTAVTYGPLDDPSLAPFTDGYDVFGDGALIALPTPGHTPGSMSLLVRRDGAAPLLLVGDVTYDLAALREGSVPGTGATRLQQETTGRINRLTEALPGLRIVAAHDPGAAAQVGS